MSFDTVITSRIGAVTTITLNRPQRRNALNQQLLRELREAMAEAAADPTVRAIILTGAGTAFCAGLDLREMGSGDGDLQLTAAADASTSPWEPHPKPVVGAINGPAITGGLEIALHCDFLVAAETATFADTHARVGVIPGWGLSYLLPQAVGLRRAREMSLTSRLVPATEAHVWGLVNHVVPAADLLATARSLADSICEVAPAMAVEFLTLYQDNAASTLAEAAVREVERSHAWLRKAPGRRRDQPPPAP